MFYCNCCTSAFQAGEKRGNISNTSLLFSFTVLLERLSLYLPEICSSNAWGEHSVLLAHFRRPASWKPHLAFSNEEKPWIWTWRIRFYNRVFWQLPLMSCWFPTKAGVVFLQQAELRSYGFCCWMASQCCSVQAKEVGQCIFTMFRHLCNKADVFTRLTG